MAYEPLDNVLDAEKADPVLQKGKRVTIEFVSNPSTYIRATQIGIIEGRLNSNPDIEIISANYWGENFITFEVEVKNSESLMTERKIIGCIMAASPVFFYLVHKPVVDKTAKDVIEGAKNVLSWTPTMAVAIGVIVVLYLFRK